MPEKNAPKKEPGDAEAIASSVDSNQNKISAVRQLYLLLLLMLKLKAWRSIIILLPMTAALSNLYLPTLLSSMISKPKKGETIILSDGLKFYSTSDLSSSGFKVLVDRDTFPTEVAAATSIMTKRGGNAKWMKDCTPDDTCRAEFVGEIDSSVIAYIRYSNSPDRRTILECFSEMEAKQECSLLFQLMAQSMSKPSITDGVFQDVRFFKLNDLSEDGLDSLDMENMENKKLSLPKSICSEWIDDNMFPVALTIVLCGTYGLLTITLSLYILVSTISSIRTLKADGFMQQLFRNGLSVTSYWTVIWLITICECVLLSILFLLSHTLKCPDVYPSDYMMPVLLLFNFYCISIAGLLMLMELLIPSILPIFMLSIALSIAVIGTSLTHILINKMFPWVLTLFPPFSAHMYTLSKMIADITKRQNAKSPSSYSQEYIQSILTSNGISAVIIICLVVYFDCVLKGGNGLCLPVYYPLCPSYWFTKRSLDDKGAANIDDDKKEAEPHIEPVIDLSPSIIVSKVSKAYKDCCCSRTPGPRVLHGLSCKIYKNQITALIGHNGAGKSTLIKILTGEECPDEGVAYISGHKVTDPLERLALRGSISICPQFDSLCGALTVMECVHVTLNSKGIRGGPEVEKAREMLRSLGLGDKENVKSTDLSGGQKRKVNTILALLGNTDVVFLDEPTSGLDPVSRRQLWQLLQEAKVARTIILCTQFMDEADILADRKIFLCGGQIVCAGSSMFLKRAFGCSFILNVSLRSKSDAPALMSRLKLVRLKSQFETELQLEVAASEPNALIAAVQVLESSGEIQAFGLSEATLDDIFMRLSGVSSTDIINAFRSGELAKLTDKSEKGAPSDTSILKKRPEKSETTNSTIYKQFCALLFTNLKRQVRTRASIWSRFIIPVVLLALLGFATRYMMRSKTESEHMSIISSEYSTDVLGETDMLTVISKLRSRVHAVGNLESVCIHDGPSSPAYNDSCLSLSLSDEQSSKSPYLIEKSQSENLQSFLVKNSTIQRLLDGCGEKTYFPCIVYYATSWNKTDFNRNRSITIGIFYGSQDAHDSKLSHVYRRAYTKISKLFGAGDIKQVTALSHMLSQSAFTSTEMELMIFLCIFNLFPVSYLNDPVEDIVSRVRGHLLSMGMTHFAYWINTFFMHWVQYSVCFIIAVGLLNMWDRYRNFYFILVACLPTFFLGTASNQMTMYTIAAVGKTSNTIVSLSCIFFFAILPIILIVASVKAKVAVVPLILCVPPLAPVALLYFSVCFAIYTQEYYHIDSVSNIPGLFDIFVENLYIQLPYFAMPAHIIVMFCIISLAENGAAIVAACRHRNPVEDSEHSASPMDPGAQKESDRVLQSTRNQENILEVRQLRKTYSNGVKAVRGVTFGSMAGEIFGLLGANGAGKSTTMSVIVGEETQTGGNCEVRMKDGSWVSGRHGASNGAIGYCPQHNPLFDNITVEEHLNLYSDIRGVPINVAKHQIAALIQGLGLKQHKDKYSRQLSGGNKRRLCLAISMLGDPSLIVIDEASTGVDPENKRFIWSAIREMLQDKRSVMVTTHSMEEVEALCNRVGIMNKGRMIAFGTVQQLRSLHGDAYTLDVLLLPSKSDTLKKKKSSIKSLLAAQFRGILPLEDLGLGMQYYVPKGSVGTISDALRWLNDNRSRLGIDYYAFYQMSLDQVFVKLVKQFDSSSASII